VALTDLDVQRRQALDRALKQTGEELSSHHIEARKRNPTPTSPPAGSNRLPQEVRPEKLPYIPDKHGDMQPENLPYIPDKHGDMQPENLPYIPDKHGKPEEQINMGASLRRFIDNYDAGTSMNVADTGNTYPTFDELMANAKGEENIFSKAIDKKLSEFNATPRREVEIETDVYDAAEEYSAGPAPMGSGEMITQPGQITKDFSAEEFACKGTGEVKVSDELVHRLQQLRDYLGVPVVITSGYRSPEHNASVNGAPNSRHISGEAADIQAEGVSMAELAEAAKKFFGDGGIGSSYSNHVHVDVGPARTW